MVYLSKLKVYLKFAAIIEKILINFVSVILQFIIISLIKGRGPKLKKGLSLYLSKLETPSSKDALSPF